MTRHEHLAPLQVLEVQASQEAFCLCPDRQKEVDKGQGREEGEGNLSYRKRTSKRRWKARARAGKPIPQYAVLAHKLDRWFKFERFDMKRAYAFASPVTVASK